MEALGDHPYIAEELRISIFSLSIRCDLVLLQELCRSTTFSEQVSELRPPLHLGAKAQERIHDVRMRARSKAGHFPLLKACPLELDQSGLILHRHGIGIDSFFPGHAFKAEQNGTSLDIDYQYNFMDVA